MVLNYKFEINESRIDEKIKNRLNKIKPLFTQEILKDINTFAPKLTGNLIGSSLSSSDFRKGRIIYNTKYAKYVHSSPKVRRISTRINKNAKKQWVTYAENAKRLIWKEKLKKLWKMI